MAAYNDYTFEDNHVRHFPENIDSNNLVWHRDIHTRRPMA